jgi:hypothetical protein
MEFHNRLIIFVAVIVVLVHIVVAKPSNYNAGQPKESLDHAITNWITKKLFYYMYYLEGFHTLIALGQMILDA